MVTKTKKFEWIKIGEGDYTARDGDRIFRLRADSYGVLGIGCAYYLTTKWVSETEFKPVVAICVSGDNHDKHIDKRLNPEDKKYVVTDLELLFKIVERDYINTLY